MALDLGELSARVSVDASSVPRQLGGVQRRFEQAGRQLGAEGDRIGRDAGDRMGSGIQQGASRGVSRLGTVLGVGARAFGGLTAAGVGALGLVGAAGVGMGVKVAAGNEQARISFTTMLGSAKAADSFLRDLQKFAASTPFEFPELQTAASSLISAGIEADKVIPIMTTLGDVTSGMGTGSEGVKRATIALQQMSAAGRITGEDLNQLRDAGIPVYDLLSKATGKSKEEVVKLAQAGKLGKKELGQMMEALSSGKGLERFNGLMQKQSQSLTGMWSTMKDTIGQGLASAITPLIPLIKQGLGGATTFVMRVLQRLPGVLDRGIRAVQDFAKSDAWATIKRYGSTVLGGLVTGVRALPGLIRRGIAAVQQFAASEAWAGIKDAVRFGIGALAAAVRTARTGIRQLAPFLGGMASALIRNRDVVIPLAAGIGAMVVAVRAARLAMLGFAAAQRIVNVLFAMNPFGIVVLALVGLGVALYTAYQKSERFRRVVDGVFSWVRRAVPAALRRVRDAVVGDLEAIRDFFAKAGARIVIGVGGFLGRVRRFFSDSGRRIEASVRGDLGAVRDFFANVGRRISSGVVNFLRNVRDTFTGMGRRVKASVRSDLEDVRGFFANLGRRAWQLIVTLGRNVRTSISDMGKRVKETVTALFDDNTGLRYKFRSAVAALGRLWDGLKAKMREPIKGVIDIVNKGIIGSFNWIIGKLKLPKSMELAKLGYPKGWHDGGYTGQKDPREEAGPVHGDEFVVKSPSRRVFEQRHPGALDYLNRHGDLPGYLSHGRGYAQGGLVRYQGHRFTAQFASRLRAAHQEHPFRISQGGFRPRTSYSGTSHAGDAVDLTPVTAAIVKSLRRRNIAAWDRTGMGRWRPHIHGVPLPSAGRAGGSGVWQAQDYMRGGNGMGGRDNGAGSSGPNRAGNAGGSGLGGFETVKAGWLGAFADPAAFLASKAKAAMDKLGLSKLGGAGWGGVVRRLPGLMLDKVVGKAKGFASALWTTVKAIGGHVKQMFTSPGKAGSMSAEQMGHAATIASVGSGGGRRAQIIGLITALVESNLRNVGYGDRDSVGLFQQRAPWGPRSARMNPATSASMFYNGGRGGQRGLYDIRGWDRMDPGAAAQEVQVSAYPGRYRQHIVRAGNILDQLKPGKGYALGTNGAHAGVYGVAEHGPELVVNPGYRRFRGGERVHNTRDTMRQLQAAGTGAPMVGHLTLVERGTTRETLREVGWELRKMANGGVHNGRTA